MENRRKAIEWYNNLTHSEKGLLMENDFQHRHPQSLTGREIEILFNQKKYKYRNLPITDSEWYVAGEDTSDVSYGVLEWCYDEGDAESRLELMKKYSQFKDLSIGNFKEDKNEISAKVIDYPPTITNSKEDESAYYQGF